MFFSIFYMDLVLKFFTYRNDNRNATKLGLKQGTEHFCFNCHKMFLYILKVVKGWNIINMLIT